MEKASKIIDNVTFDYMEKTDSTKTKREQNWTEGQETEKVQTKLRDWTLWKGLSDRGWLHVFVGPSVILRCSLKFNQHQIFMFYYD